MQNKSDDVKKKLAALPQGNISYKIISGNRYAYYQWTENGKQRSRRVKDEEFKKLDSLIERRKKLQGKIKSKEFRLAAAEESYDFKSLVRIGAELAAFTKTVSKWKKRNCFSSLRDYVHGKNSDRVFILYGLRRTGKTTLIRQVINGMSDKMKSAAAFIQVRQGLTMADINQDLKHLEKSGFKYVFVDEVTLLDDFIEGAALFSDIFASSGMKITLSGTDSLGFVFAQDEQLYDRCVMCHTTFIPYGEFENVLGVKGIDNYIQFGGTMSMSGLNYNSYGIFSSRLGTEEYLDAAIAKNIQHSLKNYQNHGHFRSLLELYEKNELTSAINRVVEDINHEFTLEVLTREWKSADLGISARNLRNDRKKPSDILDRIDKKKVSAVLKGMLEIKNKGEQIVALFEEHKNQIKEYLDLLDLTVEVETRWLGQKKIRPKTHTVFSQPGIRYSQAKSLVASLLEDELFMNLNLDERNRINEKILESVRGRMMEDIVILETKVANPDKEVFKLQFSVGEFDMVVFDRQKANCRVYEIKHSAEIVAEQRRHLLDKNKCEKTALKYGTIAGKYVIYRGEKSSIGGVEYLNVEEYLAALVY